MLPAFSVARASGARSLTTRGPRAPPAVALGSQRPKQPRGAGRPALRRVVPKAASQAEAQQQKRVVLAVDASEDSIAAFTWVLQNLLRPEDELHLLHVVPDVFTSPASGSVYYCSSPDPETERLLWNNAKQFFLDNFVEPAKERGLEDAVTLHLVKESRHHHIGKAVCKKADELAAAPLVLAAHDRGPLEKLLLGSVSDYCVTHSKRPVLLLHREHSALQQHSAA